MIYKRGYSMFIWMVFLVVVTLVFSVIFTVAILLKKSPSELFKQYILDPIPKSVTQIRAHRPWELSGHDLTPNYVPTLIRELSMFFILQSDRRSVAEPGGLQLTVEN